MGYTGNPNRAPRIKGAPYSAEVSYGQDGEKYTEFTVVITPPARLSEKFLYIYAGLGEDGFTELNEMASTPEFTYLEGHIQLEDSEIQEGVDGIEVGIGMIGKIVDRLNAISSGDLSN